MPENSIIGMISKKIKSAGKEVWKRRHLASKKEFNADDCKGGHVSDYAVTVDSLKFVFPKRFLFKIDKDRFLTIKEERTVREFGKKKKIIVEAYKCVPEEIRGIGRIMVYPKQVVVSISAKILGCDYRQLLHLGNIREALHLIQRTGLMFFDVEKVIREGETTSLDCTKNIQLGGEKGVREYIGCTGMLAGANTWNYTYKPGRKGGLGSIFKRDGEVLKFYYKHYQIQLLSKSKGDLAAYDHVVTNGWEAESLGYVRVEATLRNKAKMLERLGIKDRKIISVFSAKKCPIVGMFENIISHASLKKLDKYNDFLKLDLTKMKIKDREKMIHVCYLIEKHNSCIPAIRAELLMGPDDKGRVSRYISQHVKPEINRRLANKVCENIGGVQSIENRLEIMKEYLKAG